MSNLKPDSIIACLDCPDHVQAVLDASMWVAKILNAPIGLLHAMPNTHRATAVSYSGCLTVDDETHLLQKFTTEEHDNNSQIKDQGKLLLKQAESYCLSRQYQKPIYALHRHTTLAESIDYVDDEAQLIVIGHNVTCKHTLAQLIRPSKCPILVTHAPFSPPRSALFAFDNRPTCHALLDWLCHNALIRPMAVHIVMVGKETESNKDALREAYARLKQSGINCKKALIDERDVTAALLYYQKQHQLELLMTGAFGESRLREIFYGSDTQKLLGSSKSPYLLFPSE
ncbi:universal stress protein [Psychrobacter sp. I-STPA6b]|uniref:universal stress protein n=1 Tax=Psychrobacter sp. I-STPA6b TaxID=2585718 RepID=UPI001D0CA2C7|nr:universal stress protein [Psychrobacter sp. I-STPA6b]